MHLMINVYRSVYNLFVVLELFNHDLQEDEFVTKKIVSDLIKVKYKELSLTLGNIHVKRDWGML